MIIDRMEARLWADHHSEFGRWASGVAHDVAEAFRVLARVRYEQPWRDADAPDGRH